MYSVIIVTCLIYLFSLFLYSGCVHIWLCMYVVIATIFGEKRIDKNDSNDIGVCLFGVLNDTFVASLAGLVAYQITYHDVFFVHARLICRCCASFGAIFESLHFTR